MRCKQCELHIPRGYWFCAHCDAFRPMSVMRWVGVAILILLLVFGAHMLWRLSHAVDLLDPKLKPSTASLVQPVSPQG
jgi:hypothetical protein